VASRRNRSWVPPLKTALGLLVILAVGRHVWKTWDGLAHRDPPLEFAPGWTAAAVVPYVLGLAACGAFYARLLRESATPIGVLPAVRAYLISHLGKYVPGKALVLVMRAGLSLPFGARPATAAFATLYETLTMMAAGGLLAAALFALPPAPWIGLPGTALKVPLALVGLAAGLAFLVFVEVRVFKRVAATASLPFSNVGPDALPRLRLGLLGEGLAWTALGWVLLGLSQVLVIHAIVPEGLAVSKYPAVIASVALATVVGFAVPIAPGGLGVREWALWTGLGAALDHDRAVVAALLLRLVWVVGELIAAAVVLPLGGRRVASEDAEAVEVQAERAESEPS
jgi:uncharacterized membrane protein YbhN (UPF0104 family)